MSDSWLKLTFFSIKIYKKLLKINLKYIIVKFFSICVCLFAYKYTSGSTGTNGNCHFNGNSAFANKLKTCIVWGAQYNKMTSIHDQEENLRRV